MLSQEQQPEIERRARAEKKAANRRLAQFFVCSAIFIAIVIGTLFLIAIIMKRGM